MKPWERYQSGPWTRFQAINPPEDEVAPVALPEEEPAPRFQTRGLGVPDPVIAEEAPPLTSSVVRRDARPLPSGEGPIIDRTSSVSRRGDAVPEIKQPVSDLGKRTARGATEIVASVPEALGIMQSSGVEGRIEDSRRGLGVRQEQIDSIVARLADPSISDDERLMREQQLVDLQQGQDAIAGQIGVLEERAAVPTQERPVFKLGDRIRERSADVFGDPDPQFDDRFASKLAEGGGSLLGFAGVTALTGWLGGGLTGAAVNSAQLYNEAIDYGASEDEARTAAAIGAAIGTTEVIPIGRALDRFTGKAKSRVAGALSRRLVSAAETAGEEGIQEAATQIANNLTASGIYDPDREWSEGALEAAAIGAILGGGLGALTPGPASFPRARDDDDPERINSPRLTPSDRASPLPNAIIDDGKKAVEDILAGRAPTAPQAGVAPLDEAALNVRLPETDVVQRPLPTVRLSPTLGAPSQPDAAPRNLSEPLEDSANPGRFVQVDLNTGQIVDAAPTQPAAAPVARPERTFEDVPEMDGETDTGRTVRVYDDGQVEYLDPQANQQPAQINPQPVQEQNAQTQEPVPQTQEPVAVSDVPEPFKANVFLENEDLTSIEADPETFQYKSGGDNQGVTDRLLGVKRWETDRAGQAIVYEYADGRRVIADGHQRLGLAKRLSAEGQDVSMPVTVFREVDGYKPEDIMVRAALKNVAESDAKDPNPEAIIDAAKVLRARPDITPADMNLPNGDKSALGRNALSLRNLSDEAFGMVVNERASMRSAIAVANAVSDKAAQANILSVVEKSGARNKFEAEMVAKQAAADTVTQTQDSLFGSEDVTETLYLERARVMDQAIKRLRTEASAFKTILRNAGNIEGVGENRVDRDASAQKASEDAAAQEYITRLANSKGPISDALTEAARSLKAGGNTGQAVTGFVQAVRRGIQESGSGRQGSADVGGNPEQVRGQQEGPQLDLTADSPAPTVETATKALTDARATFDKLDQNKKIENAQEYFAASSALSQARDGMADALAERGGRIELKSNKGLGAVITPRPDGKPGARITYFDNKGFSGDTSHDTLKAAVRDAIGQGYEVESPGLLKQKQQGGQWQSPAETERVRREAEGQSTEPAQPVIDQGDADWWARASRESDGKEARDVLEKAGLGFDRVGRPWKDLRATDRAKILDAKSQAPATEQTDAGEQTLMPGVAPITKRDRQRAEIERRQNSRMSGRDEGPGSGRDDLFGAPEDRRDLFDAAPEPQTPLDAAKAEMDRAEAEYKREFDRHETVKGQYRDRTIGDDEFFASRDRMNAAMEKADAARSRWSELDQNKPAEVVNDGQVDMFGGANTPVDMGKVAASAGDDRKPPADMSSEDMTAWLNAYDAEVSRMIEASKAESRDKGGKIIEGQPKVKVTDYKPAPDAPTLQEPQTAQTQPKIQDFGEKIGGARKDTATSTGPRGSRSSNDGQPGWRNRYAVIQNWDLKASQADKDKWMILDKRTNKGVRDGFRTKLFDTEAQAAAAVPLYEVARNHKVYSNSKGGFAIHRLVSDRKRPVVKDGFGTREEAMKYMADNPVEIIEFKTRIDDTIHPALEQAIRVGEERRANGRDVVAEDFGDIFGFRGVEFGEWNNGAERQHILNQAYDALLDMAEIIRVPPRALSLNGEIGLAFGARGHGLSSARAHYEMDHAVINLTKIKGAGSLAHEWWHAVDHYLARIDGKASSERLEKTGKDKDGKEYKYWTFDAKGAKEDFASWGFLYKSGMREEMRDAIKGVMDAVSKRKMEYTEDQSTREKIANRRAGDIDKLLDQWRAGLATEQRYGRKTAPATPEQLKRFDAAADRIRKGDMGEIVNAPSKSSRSFRFYEPILEIAEINKEVRGRQAYGVQQNRLTGDAVRLQNAVDVRTQDQKFLEDAKAEKVKTKTVRSEFYSNAWAMDEGRVQDYWSTNHELSARAFEAFVYDRLKEIDARNDFLAYEKHNDLPEYRLFNVKPYPEGQERADINAAFEKLFDVIETSTADDGAVMMYQRPLDMFYSPLLKAVDSAKQKQAPAQDWKAIVAKLPGVKKAELEWLGVDEWLDAQGGQVSRDALVAFIRDSQIEIVEDLLGGRPDGFDADFEVLRDDESAEGWSDADIEEQVLADAEMAGTYTPANFENYTEDGGDNYREILLRVPNLHESGKNKPPAADFGEVNRIQAQMDALLQEGQAPTELDADTYKEWKRLQNERNLARAADVARRGENRKRPFVQSSHFEQENIVVHARVKDRVGPNGERVLFVEEIQSDLASKWRENSEAPEVTARRRELGAERDRLAEDRRGLTGRVASVLRDEFEAAGVDGATSARKAVFAIEDRVNQGADQGGEGALYANLLREVDIETYQSVVDLMRERKAVQDELIALGTEKTVPEGTPDTPFKEEHTYNLMVKRLLRMATEEGYDQLSWTPGYMQAERWNSAAQSVVEGIEWDSAEIPGYRYVNIQMASGGQSFSVSVEPSGRIEGSTNRELEGKQLSSLVGPGLAKQIMTEQSGRADNQKITFPDSGYAIAYDQQTKRAVDKLVKKHGTQVRVDKSLPDFEQGLGALINEAAKMPKAEILSRFDSLIADIMSRTDQTMTEGRRRAQQETLDRRRQNLVRALDADEVSYGLQAFTDNDLKTLFPEFAQSLSSPVWSVTITDDLREAAMQPMPMFRRGNTAQQTKAAVWANLPALRAELDKMGLTDVDLQQVEPDPTYQGALRIDRKGGMTILIGASLDPEATLRHEAIHALSAMNLFKGGEWRLLTQRAQRDWLAKHDIEARYPDLSRLEQIEEAIAEEYAAWATAGGKEQISAFAKIKKFLEALGNMLRGRGFQTVEDVFGGVSEGVVGRRNGRAVGQSMRMQEQPDTFAAEFLTELAAVDDLFSLPVAKSGDLETAISEVDPDLEYVGVMGAVDVAGKDGVERILVRDRNNSDIFIYQTDDEVWVDVSRLKEGGGGNAVYAAVGDYAANSDRVFIGDPDGLSDVAVRRRTDNMLSSALRHGSTNHLAPHQQQIDGDPNIGVPPLRWRDGDTFGNVQELIRVSTESLAFYVPEIKDSSYDFTTGAFRDVEGKRLDAEDVQRWASQLRGMREARAGGRTLQRGILFNALSRASSEEQSKLLERVLRQPGKLVSGGLSGIFYQRPNPNAQGRDAIASGTNTPAIPDRQVFDEALRENATIFARASGIKGALRDDLDSFRIRIQDRMLPLRRAEEAISELTGGVIDKKDSAYFAEERYSGRVGFRLDKIRDEYTNPIARMIGKAGDKLSLTDPAGETLTGIDAVDLYLWARHAKERNARIAKINPSMGGPSLEDPYASGTGSGLSDAQADAIIQQAEKSMQRKTYRDIGAMADRLGQEMIQWREDAGLLSKEEAAIWRAMYRNYVPLRGFAETDMHDAIANEVQMPGGAGGRYSARGKESKRALGRSSKAYSPLSTMISMAEEVTVRAEKNLVARTLYNLAEKYPAPAMWRVKSPETKRYFNSQTGTVETRVVDPASVMPRPNEVALKINGIEKRVELVDPRMAEAMSQLGTMEMGAVTRFASMFSRLFSATNTMLSPPFVIVNAFRDMVTAQINLGQLPKEMRGKVRTAAVRDWIKSFGGSYSEMRGGGTSEYAQYFREFSEVGAKVSFWQIENPEARSDSLRKAVRRESGGRLNRTFWKSATFDTDVNPVLNWIETVNLAVDNSVRLSVYVEGRRQGMSVEEAASLSKNLTVNFNRRGEWGATMNAWFPFANAAVQGSHVLVKAMKAPQVQALLGGAFVTGLAMEFLNAALSERDEDDELAHDKIPDYISQRNLIIPTGGDSRVTIPLPYGYNVFFYAGQQMAKAMRGVKEEGQVIRDVTKATFGAFSPISGEGLAQTLMPTLGDHMMELATNKDWLGRPIRPESPYADFGPQAYKMFKNEPPAPFQMASDLLNRGTGGSQLEPGLIDVSPEYLHHTFKFLTGGAGRFVDQSLNLGVRAVQGDLDLVEAHQVPLLRTVRYQPSEFLDQGRYFEFRQNVENARAMVDKRARELGIGAPENLVKAASLYPQLRAAERQRRDISERIDAIYADRSLSFRERRERLAPLEERRSAVYAQFNRAYVSAMGPQSE